MKFHKLTLILLLFSCNNNIKKSSINVLNPSKVFNLEDLDKFSLNRVLEVDMPIYTIKTKDTLTSIYLDEKMKKIITIEWEIAVDFSDSIQLYDFFKNYYTLQSLSINYSSNGIYNILLHNYKNNMTFYGFIYIINNRIKKIKIKYSYPF